ncbi:MAG: sigma-70 family RNA polymerase sigma factor [Bacteroidota bacterium]
MYPSHEDEFERTRQQYEAELRAFVADRLASDGVEDLLQEVWTSYSGALEREAIEQPRAWLYRTVRNRLTDAYRARQRQPIFTDLQDTDVPEEAFESEYDADDFWEQLYDALDDLPDKQREVFVRNELEGETLQEIAQTLGEKLKTIISRKQYAKQRLRVTLADLYYDFFDIDQEI